MLNFGILLVILSNLDHPLEQVQAATPQIITSRGDGSGVCIDPRGYILTARHVTQKTCYVHFIHRRKEIADVIYVEQGGRDSVVLLKCRSPGKYPYLRVSRKAPIKNKTPVISVGYQGNNFRLERGKYLGNHFNAFVSDSQSRLFDGYSFQGVVGMSGGPILAYNYEVVSLNVATGGCGFNYYTLIEIAAKIPENIQ